MAVLSEKTTMALTKAVELLERDDPPGGPCGEIICISLQGEKSSIRDLLDTIADLRTKLAAAEEREARLRKLVEKYGLTGYTVARVHKEQKP